MQRFLLIQLTPKHQLLDVLTTTMWAVGKMRNYGMQNEESKMWNRKCGMMLIGRGGKPCDRCHSADYQTNLSPAMWYKKAQLTLSNPRDVKACQNCSNSTCFVSFHRIPFPQIANL